MSLPRELASNAPSEMQVTQSNKLSISIGVCAYNEDGNIGKLLESLQRQELHQVEIVQIIVVSSACHDQTDEIVELFHRSDHRIELIKQLERKGKASAVNLFLQAVYTNICVLISADTISPPHTIECLCLPFFDERVGMTGGRPIPVNNPSTFMGFVSHLIWNLAYEVSLTEPKLGELVAFRNILNQIPEDTAVDEANIEAEVKKKGYNLKYVPDATIYNRGPDTISDYIKQRRRIYAGHLYLKKTKEYTVSTMSSLRLLKLVIRSVKPSWRSIVWIPPAMMMELYARFLGTYDFYIKRRNPHIWDIVSSTKVAIEDDSNPTGYSPV